MRGIGPLEREWRLAKIRERQISSMWCTRSVPASSFFSEEELLSLLQRPVPRHIAIIPDGHRRWLQMQQVGLRDGYNAGATLVETVVEAAHDIGVEVVTFYAFSTENWRRPQDEIDIILEVFLSYLETYKIKMVEQGIRFETIGDLSLFPSSFCEVVEEARAATRHQKEITVVMALNYGARDELRRTCRRLLDAYERGEVDKEALSEKVIATYLDTAPYGDPDLLIRTSGEQRLSNFLLWQLAYTELYVTPRFWPDFTPHDLLDAVRQFQERRRRRGE